MMNSVPENNNRSEVGNHAGRALVIPPAGWGSLGDLAMVNGALSALKATGIASVDLALPPPEDRDVAPFDNFVDGLNWFYKGDLGSQARLLDSIGRYSHVFLIGADCLDGSYNPMSITRRVELIIEAIRLGNCGRIIGTSFKENADALCLKTLRKFPAGGQIFARDPVSRHWMEKLIGRPIAQAADLAFLCPPDPHHRISAPVLEWIEKQRSKGRRVVALNINALLGRTIDGFAIAHNCILVKLLENDVSVILVSNDTRRKQNDEYFLRLAAGDLWSEAAQAIRWLPAFHPSATKAVLGAVDLLITSRMHAAILAAGAGRPALSFVYQGKFEGLYELLSLDRGALLFKPADLVENPAAMAGQVMNILAHAETHAGTISGSLPYVRELAMRNFSCLPK
jgi:polysaccharide pyruvyl transferase WcaK-like protein